MIAKVRLLAMFSARSLVIFREDESAASGPAAYYRVWGARIGSSTGRGSMFYEPRKRNHGLPHDPFKAIVAPRPIGWITSLSAKGEINLARRRRGL